MMSRRRAICLSLLPVGTIALIWVSGVALWLALGLATVGAILPNGSDRTSPSGTGRFAAIALMMGSVFVGLALLEATLWAFDSRKPMPSGQVRWQLPSGNTLISPVFAPRPSAPAIGGTDRC